MDVNDVSGSGNDGSNRDLAIPIDHNPYVSSQHVLTMQFVEDNPNVIPMDVPKTITLKIGIQKNFSGMLLGIK